jgi:hypothetical protein
VSRVIQWTRLRILGLGGRSRGSKSVLAGFTQPVLDTCLTVQWNAVQNKEEESVAIRRGAECGRGPRQVPKHRSRQDATRLLLLKELSYRLCQVTGSRTRGRRPGG